MAKSVLNYNPTFHELNMENYEQEILLFKAERICSVLQTQFGDYMVWWEGVEMDIEPLTTAPIGFAPPLRYYNMKNLTMELQKFILENYFMFFIEESGSDNRDDRSFKQRFWRNNRSL